MRRQAMRRVVAGAWILVLCLASGPVLARGGVVFGLGFGGAVVQGEGYAPLEGSYIVGCTDHPSSGIAPICHDAIHTAGSQGFGLAFRLGYNFFGYASLEAALAGHGNSDSGGGTWEGAAHVGGLVRIFPAQFFKAVRSRWWDPNVYVGGGYSWMGYHLKSDWMGVGKRHDGRGWTGVSVQTGAAVDVYLTKTVSVGADLRFVIPRYTTYYHSWEDNVTFTPKSTPSTLVFMPMATVTFHFADPQPGSGVEPIVK